MYISVYLECYTSETGIYFEVIPYVEDSMTYYGAASFDDSSAFDTTCEANNGYLSDYVYEDMSQDANCIEIEMARNPSL